MKRRWENIGGGEKIRRGAPLRSSVPSNSVREDDAAKVWPDCGGSGTTSAGFRSDPVLGGPLSDAGEPQAVVVTLNNLAQVTAVSARPRMPRRRKELDASRPSTRADTAVRPYDECAPISCGA